MEIQLQPKQVPSYQIHQDNQILMIMIHNLFKNVEIFFYNIRINVHKRVENNIGIINNIDIQMF